MLDGMFGAANILSDSGIIRIYGDAGTPDIPAGQPALGASHGTLLAEMVLNADSYAAAAASTSYMRITANAVTSDSSANASGDAVYFVEYDDDATDVALCQGTVATSGGDMTIDNVTVAAGAVVSCSAAYIQIPKGWST